MSRRPRTRGRKCRRRPLSASADPTGLPLLRYGVPFAAAVTTGTLGYGEDVEVWVWGGLLVIGVPLFLLGLMYHVMFRGLTRLERRWSPDLGAHRPAPQLLRLERVLLWPGAVLTLTWLLLSGALLLRGEQLF
ncbi:MAG TPA: hypothetical protein VFR07_05185 [Mycobacteriales bacterium]|nr:hypothetical protein [Mycobacteriales bacterium]